MTLIQLATPDHNFSDHHSSFMTAHRRSLLKKVVYNSRNNDMLQDMPSKTDFVLSKLTTEELEVAAQTSYEYLKYPVLTQRNQYAKRMVQRYVESKKGNVDLALEKIQRTLKFRQNIQIVGLMTAFDNKGDAENAVQSETAQQLFDHLSTKKFFVQGYDKEGRSTLYFIPRLVQRHDKEWTVKEAIYSIERAIACSRAENKTINAVVDFSGFSMTKHSPPVDIGKEFLTTLRSHYAGQINHIYLTNTPFSFSILWKIFSPFVGTNTRDKIKFVNGSRSKERELLQVYDLEEVPAWLIHGGKSNKPLDVYKYLYEIPFDQPYNHGQS